MSNIITLGSIALLFTVGFTNNVGEPDNSLGSYGTGGSFHLQTPTAITIPLSEGASHSSLDGEYAGGFTL